MPAPRAPHSFLQSSISECLGSSAFPPGWQQLGFLVHVSVVGLAHQDRAALTFVGQTRNQELCCFLHLEKETQITELNLWKH